MRKKDNSGVSQGISLVKIIEFMQRVFKKMKTCLYRVISKNKSCRKRGWREDL
jgi:hypothetical protein